MPIIDLDILGKRLYLNPLNGDISDNYNLISTNGFAIDPKTFIDNFKPKTYSFCLNISDECNLRCSYCFNPNKKNRVMPLDEAIRALETFFSLFSDGEKYFVDLSGKGEPLLNKDTIKGIADYCHLKSNELKREVLPMLVCNGTMLNEENVTFLQESGILFGVSLDGIKEVHDRYRKNVKGDGTYDSIIKNILSIKHREYVGCAATLTNDVYDLSEAITELSQIFNTLSFRLCRGTVFGLNDEASKEWQKQYEKLALRLQNDIDESNPKIFKCLMNGDDLFGRYLYRMFGNSRTLNRCDGMISRFTYDIDGKIYGCPASFGLEEFALNPSNIKEMQHRELQRQTTQCLNCPFKWYCGGECKIEEKFHNGINKANCSLKIHLIKLAAYLKMHAINNNFDFFKTLNDFCKEKRSRYGIDPSLKKFCDTHPNLSFIEAKNAFDEANKRY